MADNPLSKYMKMLRKKHGYTQADLAKKLGITRSNYSHYETGFSQTPNDILDGLAQIYEVPLVNFIKLSALAGKESKQDIRHKSGPADIIGVFVDNPNFPSEDPLYIEFIRNIPEMNDKELRNWLSPDDMEMIYNYHKLTPKNRRLAMYILKILVLHA